MRAFAILLCGCLTAPACGAVGRNSDDDAEMCTGGVQNACDPDSACERDADCRYGCGPTKLCRHAASCSAILAAIPASRDGVFSIDPDGNGPIAAYPVYCDMTSQGGGWMLVGKLGDESSHYFSTLFDTDFNVTQLLDGNEPSSVQYAHWDLNRFNSYGSAWTVRVSIDSAVALSPPATGTKHQYSYYRPRGGMNCLPGTAGANWLGSTTPSLLEHRTGAHDTWPRNTTWLPLGPYHPYQPSAATLWIFGYRDESAGAVGCLDDNQQTKLCHSPPGVVFNQLETPEGSLTGTYTAAFGLLDGVAHEHGKRATYWLRNAREP